MFRLGAALRHIDTGVRLDVGGELLCCARYSGVELHIIRTDAQNIKPVNLMNTTRTSMENTNYYGVNGGFFNMSGDNRTLNIALENGNVVGPYSSFSVCCSRAEASISPTIKLSAIFLSSVNVLILSTKLPMVSL